MIDSADLSLRDADKEVRTLAEIFRHQNQPDVCELLESAHAWFEQTEYDNWNGGTYTWALRLEVPVAIFASVESRLLVIEKEIKGKLETIWRRNPSDQLGEVTVFPATPGAETLGQRMAPPEKDVQRLWPEGRFRLFLSHLATHKVEVSSLKIELAKRGVAAFVAHEDIVPSLEWQQEIELGLRSMHAMVALLNPGFHESKWTDQEIGWAFGRGLLVLPVRLGTDPYGFAGKFQAIKGTLEQPAGLAREIVKVLIAHPLTSGEMRRALVASFAAAGSYAMAKELCSLLVAITDMTDEEKAVLWAACRKNMQVAGAWGVTDDIYRTFGKPPAHKRAEMADLPL